MIVSVSSITHHYGDRLALDAVSFTVEAGQILGLLGPNGSGKTTLFRILATLLTPAAGRAAIDGADVVADRTAVRSRIGVVFQRPSLDAKLTVLENLTHHGHLYGLRGSSLRAKCLDLLARFGVADRAAARAETLSGGLQRRVELSKALLSQPKVLILDEPSTGLDPSARAGFMECLQSLRKDEGVTSLLTTHLMDEADACDRIAILDDGRLVTVGTPADLKAAIGADVITMSCRGASRVAQQVKDRFGVPAEAADGLVRIERRDAHEFVPQLVEAYPGEIDSITVGKPTLDDVFRHLTGHQLWNPWGSPSPHGRGAKGEGQD